MGFGVENRLRDDCSDGVRERTEAVVFILIEF